MAGIKIHQYPLERTSIGDEDYYDIDYWTGSSYQTAKIKGSTLKNVLGKDFIDIQDNVSGYTLQPNDAGKLITNGGTVFRDLLVSNSLASPGNAFTIKGRVVLTPQLGVNIDLPNGTTITNPDTFVCGSESYYVLQRKGYTGTNWVLLEVKKSENIGTNDLIITDTIRELQVAENGTFQIVTNDANNSAVFRVGENSNERFSEIEFNTVIFDLLSKFQNPSITAGVIVEVNPNEFKFIVLPDTSNTSVYHGLINADANKTIIEKSNAGKFMFDSSLSINTFEDLRATKKGLEYSADYSANFSVRSLVDKGYVDAGLSTKIGAVLEDTTPQLGGDLDLNGNDINGTGNVDITGNVIADIVQLKGGVGTQGEMSWSVDEETVQLVMDGTTLHIGQDTFVHARNNTASIITKGTAVYATGTLGASGRITVAPMIADGSIPGRLFIGLAAEDIAIGADGQVCSYGKIRQINTTAYNDGDVLWLSPTVAGQLTATEPTAPNLKIATAFVIHDATNGTLMVRAEQGTDLHTDQRVEVSGLSEGDVLKWNTTTQRWENSQPDKGHEIYNGTDVTPLIQREKLRIVEFLLASDDNINQETVIEVNPTKLSEFTSSDIIDVAGVFKLALAENKLYFGNNQGLAEQKTLTEVFGTATEEISNVIFHVVDNKVELLVPTGEIIVGDALNRGRSSTIGAALDTLAKLVGDIFKNGIDNKLQLNVPQGYIIRGNANAEGEAQKLIQGNNKVLVTNGSGVEEEVDLVSFVDLLTATGVTANGVLNTTDLGGTARGVLGGWKITDIVVKNTTANVVTINIGSSPSGTDVVNSAIIPANGFVEVPVGTTLFSETIEQALNVSSGNWNSANLIIKFSVKKVY